MRAAEALAGGREDIKKALDRIVRRGCALEEAQPARIALDDEIRERPSRVDGETERCARGRCAGEVAVRHVAALALAGASRNHE